MSLLRALTAITFKQNTPLSTDPMLDRARLIRFSSYFVCDKSSSPEASDMRPLTPRLMFNSD
jgi:hypothetical protein